MTDLFFMTATICTSALCALYMVLRAQPRADRWEEMQRVLTTLETRCKVLERRMPPAEAAYAELPLIAELREEMSKRHHDVDKDLREMQLLTDKTARAVEAVGSELARRLEVVNQLSHTVGTLAGRGGMRVG